MAGVKYIKKTTDEAEPTKDIMSTTRKSTRQKASPEVTKPAANTKAKITKKSPVNGKATAASKTSAPKAATKKAGAKAAAAPKKAPASKAKGDAKKKASPKPKAEATAPVEKPKASRKRKASEDPPQAPVKKVKVTPKGPVINDVSTQRLNVYVFGGGEMGELGLGTSKSGTNVKRPRLHPKLAADTIGVTQIAAGGMHVLALTHDSKIYSWGVNDQGALGRQTTWEGGLKEVDDNKSDDDSDSDEDDNGINPLECTATAIPADSFPEGTTFVQVAAGDSSSFALTDDGQVWGWGTFRSAEGILGFTADIVVQRKPMLIPGLKKIKKLACGINHVLALDSNGAVFAWGCGQQNQLGRRVVERTRLSGLTPREFGLPKKSIKDIACGSYHCFATDKKDQVWTWGLNNFGQTGIPEHAGEDDVIVTKPEVVKSLSGKGISCIDSGEHHSIAVTGNGDCLTWGRIDNYCPGVPHAELPDSDVIKGPRGDARILMVPTKVKAIKEPVTYAVAATNHCIAITNSGQAYSWGFSDNFQTGLGTDDEVEVATLIENTAIRGKKMYKAYGGGQYSILTEIAGVDAGLTNGVNGTH